MHSANVSPWDDVRPAVERALLVVYNALTLAPLAWLLTMAMFVLAATLQAGHLPVYGQPDPKYTGLDVLYYLAIWLAVLGLVSLPGWLAMSALARLAWFPLRVTRVHVGVYFLSASLFFAAVLTDYAGIMTWLLD